MGTETALDVFHIPLANIAATSTSPNHPTHLNLIASLRRPRRLLSYFICDLPFDINRHFNPLVQHLHPIPQFTDPFRFSHYHLLRDHNHPLRIVTRCSIAQ